MLHKSRMWSVTDVDSPENLAFKLTQQSWTGCSSFRLGNYLYANDSTGADGAQEYAVLRTFSKPELLVQVETITFSWCSLETALELIQKINTNQFDSQLLDRVRASQFQKPVEHGSCYLCI
jgi:hypothetical protein